MTIAEYIDELESLDQRNNFKMTREEAARKVSEAYNIMGSGKEFVKALEALGLIKFEENFVNVNNMSIPLHLYQEHHTAINALIGAGFRFVKA